MKQWTLTNLWHPLSSTRQCRALKTFDSELTSGYMPLSIIPRGGIRSLEFEMLGRPTNCRRIVVSRGILSLFHLSHLCHSHQGFSQSFLGLSTLPVVTSFSSITCPTRHDLAATLTPSGPPFLPRQCTVPEETYGEEIGT